MRKNNLRRISTVPLSLKYILGALGTPAFAPKHITPGMSNGPHQSSIVTDLHELRN